MADDDGDEQEDDLISMAETVLSRASMRSIHSKASTKMLINAAKNRSDAPRAVVPFLAPRVVIHNEEPTRLTKKNDPSNLPYMHRNPAV